MEEAINATEAKGRNVFIADLLELCKAPPCGCRLIGRQSRMTGWILHAMRGVTEKSSPSLFPPWDLGCQRIVIALSFYELASMSGALEDCRSVCCLQIVC